MRSPALDRLGALGPAARPAVPLLLRLFRDGPEPERLRIAFVISRVDPLVDETLPFLRAAASRGADDDEVDVRMATEALGAIEAAR